VASKQAILTDEIVPPPALIRAGLVALPSIIRAQGERASRRFIEFFTGYAVGFKESVILSRRRRISRPRLFAAVICSLQGSNRDESPSA
jgi:hypothetical protein